MLLSTNFEVKTGNIPFAYGVAFGCQGVRPMSVDRLRDSGESPQPKTRQLQRRRV
ncbi:hypothetical protein [Candidatus Regiella insecticola]|uniref:hypothetical protein n=1 Tax=Candidatus Regiella insecticola TaxID=138073 RepID=UPI0021A85398|nr:hypothetical protein [Candidatus Regiella insecticola]